MLQRASLLQRDLEEASERLTREAQSRASAEAALESLIAELRKNNALAHEEVQSLQKQVAESSSTIQIKDAELKSANEKILALNAEIARLQALLADNNVKYENEVKQLEHKAAILAQEKDILNNEKENVLKRASAVPPRPEERALLQFINRILGSDSSVGDVIPVGTNSDSVESACASGVVLCKLINWARPGTIDERAINFVDSSDRTRSQQNHMLCLNSASAIGCKVFHINAEDLTSEAPRNALVDLGWEIIRVGCLFRVSLAHHPEIMSLFPGKPADTVSLKSPEKILLKWIRQISKVDSVANFGKDLTNCSTLVSLVSELFPEAAELKDLALQTPDPPRRAAAFLESLTRVAPDLFSSFVESSDILKGIDNIIVVFLSVLFNYRTGLAAASPSSSTPIQTANATANFMSVPSAESSQIAVPDAEGTREERAFCAWINSLRLNTFVTNLHSDVHDGVVLNQVLDKIAPGQVPWSKVAQTPKNRFAKIENGNIVIGVGKKLGFSLVGIDGSNFVERNRKLILALVWQACKHHLVSILPKMNGKIVDEAYLCSWASDLVSHKATKRPGSVDHIGSLKDPALANGVFLLQLLDAVEPGIVDSKFIADGNTSEEKMENAKYIISLARKMGCFVFCVFEDIIEGKSNMIFTILASLLKYYKDKQPK
jgi:plastin-1